MIKYATGDLLQAPASFLVNPINCTPAMGKGLALQFRNAVPGLYEHHQQLARAGQIQPGHLTTFFWSQRARTVLGLPTKRAWRDPSRLEDVEAGLNALASLLAGVAPEHRSVAVPPLGCGLGGLAWHDVHERIVRILDPVPAAEILVYSPHLSGTRP